MPEQKLRRLDGLARGTRNRLGHGRLKISLGFFKKHAAIRAEIAGSLPPMQSRKQQACKFILHLKVLFETMKPICKRRARLLLLAGYSNLAIALCVMAVLRPAQDYGPADFFKQSWQLERKQTSGSRYLSTLSQRMLPACSYVQHASYSPHCMSSTLFYKVAFVDSLRLLKSTRASHEAIQRWHEMERMSRHCILVKKGAPFPVDHSLKSLRK